MSDAEVLHDKREVTVEEEAGDRPQAPAIESRFLFVDVAALRAKQLRRGAKSRLEPADAEPAPPAPPIVAVVPVPPAPGVPLSRKIKAERVAMQEVRRGLVDWSLPDFKAVFDTR